MKINEISFNRFKNKKNNLFFEKEKIVKYLEDMFRGKQEILTDDAVDNFFLKIGWREWGTASETPFNRLRLMFYDQIFDKFYEQNKSKLTFDKFKAYVREMINHSKQQQ